MFIYVWNWSHNSYVMDVSQNIVSSIHWAMEQSLHLQASQLLSKVSSTVSESIPLVALTKVSQKESSGNGNGIAAGERKARRRWAEHTVHCALSS